jgi:hypothetical protein
MRIDGYARAVYKNQKTLLGDKARFVPVRHFWVSPPASVVEAILAKVRRHPGRDPEATFIKKFRTEFEKVRDVLGFKGGAVVIHLYRIQDEFKPVAEKAVKKGLYKDRYEWAKAQPNIDEILYFSPHFHITVYGKAQVTYREFIEKTEGWAYGLVRPVKYDKKTGETGTAGLISYLLGHAPVIKRRLSVTYFGCLAPTNLKHIDTIKTSEPVLCKECEADMVRMEKEEKFHFEVVDGVRCIVTDAVDWIPTNEILYRKKILKIYEIVPPPPG